MHFIFSQAVYPTYPKFFYSLSQLWWPRTARRCTLQDSLYKKKQMKKERKRLKGRRNRGFVGSGTFRRAEKFELAGSVSARRLLCRSHEEDSRALTVPPGELLAEPRWWARLYSLFSRMEGCRNTNGKSMAADHSRGFKDSPWNQLAPSDSRLQRTSFRQLPPIHCSFSSS